MEKFTLNNGVQLPVLSIGTNRMKQEKLESILSAAIDAGITFFDTARDYGNEKVVGQAIKKVCDLKSIKREDIFITTKVGNSQQLRKNMLFEIEESLNNLKTEYIDLWLLHWPYPDFYIDNYLQMEKILDSGKVRAIGIANCQERHLYKLLDSPIKYIPMVIQIEHHPLRVSHDLLQYCKKLGIIIEAYSPFCFMIDKIRKNELLISLAEKYHKTVGQIILRWHYQHQILPVFRSENPNRFKENANIFDFSISYEDMNKINSLDEDFKFIPESLHCPGY